MRKNPENIPFNRPHHAANEVMYVTEALSSDWRHGGGPFTKRCQTWLSERLEGQGVLLTQSCTAALELAALLLDLKRGDEVIMSSFNFVTTASAFALRGAVPVFVDIDPATQNIDPDAAEQAVTERTRALVAMHYGGMGCDMKRLHEIAKKNSLALIEDAAHCLMSEYDDRPLGCFGDMAGFSFHDSKNISSGEGGALVVADAELRARAETLWEKGTNRRQFERGETDKYTWVDVGSSFLPSEITAAFLLAQLEEAETITQRRLAIWRQYHEAFAGLEATGAIFRPTTPQQCRHNGHLYYLILPSREARDGFINALAKAGVRAEFHYVPLHDSPAGRHLGRTHGEMAATERAGDGLARLPLWSDMTSGDVADVIGAVQNAVS